MLKAAALRRSLLAAFLATTALTVAGAPPAYAHDGDDAGAADDISRRLSDPMTQAGVAAAASAAVGALLSVDISPLAKALRPLGGAIGGDARDVPPGTTLGDIAGRDARELPYDIARRTPQAMGALAGMAESMAAMRPQLEAMGRSFKQQMRHSLPQGLPDRHEPDRDEPGE